MDAKSSGGKNEGVTSGQRITKGSKMHKKAPQGGGQLPIECFAPIEKGTIQESCKAELKPHGKKDNMWGEGGTKFDKT